MIKKFLYNSDKSQVLVSQIVRPTAHATLLLSDLEVLEQTFKSIVTDQVDLEPFLSQIKEYKGLLSYFKVENIGRHEDIYKKSSLRHNLLSHIENTYGMALTPAQEQLRSIAEKKLKKDAPLHLFSQGFQGLICATDIFGLHASVKYKFLVLVPANNVTDTTPISRPPQNPMKAYAEFKASSSNLEKIIASLLVNHKYAPQFENKLVTLNWETLGDQGLMNILGSSTNKPKNYSVDVPLTSLIEKLASLNYEIKKFIGLNSPDLDIILAQKWKESPWNGSLDKEDGFNVNEAFYLLAKTNNDEGFIGLIRTTHQNGRYFKLKIVKDIAKAMLWHSMPSSDELAQFDSISKVNVTMSFEKVENPGMSHSASRIQAYIDKSKLSNAIPVMVAPSNEVEVKKKTPKI